ncbi:MAG: hypothetical protein ABWY51_10080 [Gaiellaceae bacterium]
MREDEHPSDVRNRVTADHQSLDLEDDADLEAQREVFLAMIPEFDEDESA